MSDGTDWVPRRITRSADVTMPQQNTLPLLSFQRPLTLLLIGALILSALSVAVAGGTRVAHGQEPDSTITEVTPESAPVYIEVTLDQSSEQWDQTYSLLDRAGFGDFSGIIEQELETGMPEAAQMLDGSAALVITEVTDDLLGTTSVVEVTDAVGEMPAEADDPADFEDPMVTTEPLPEGLAFALAPQDPSLIPEAVDAMIAQESLATGEESQTITEGDVEIQYVESEDPMAEGLAAAHIGDVLVVAPYVDDVVHFAQASEGTTGTLADAPQFGDVVTELPAESLGWGYVDTSAFMAELDASPEAEEISAFLPEEARAQYDSYSGFALWADEPGFRMESVTFPAEGAALPQANGEMPTMAERVAGDSLVLFNGYDLNSTGMLDVFGAVIASAFAAVGQPMPVPGEDPPVTEATPASPADMIEEGYAEIEAQLGFDLRGDFIDQIMGEYGFAISASDVTSPSPNVSGIFVTGVEDEVPVGNVLTTITFLASAAGGSEVVSSRDVNGNDVTVIDLSMPEMELLLEYGVVDGEMIVSLGGALDDYVAGPAESLADNPTYQAVLAELPEDYTGVQFVNVEQLLPMIDEFAGMAMQADPFDDAMQDDPFDDPMGTPEDVDDAMQDDPLDDPMGTPDDMLDVGQDLPMATEFNIIGFGGVTYEIDGGEGSGSSSILLIGE